MRLHNIGRPDPSGTIPHTQRRDTETLNTWNPTLMFFRGGAMQLLNLFFKRHLADDGIGTLLRRQCLSNAFERVRKNCGN